MQLPWSIVSPLRASRNVARVRDNGLDEAPVAYEDRQEKEVVDDEYGDRRSCSTRDVQGGGWIY